MVLKKLIILVFLVLGSLNAMDQSCLLKPYDIPVTNETDPVGGWIEIMQDIEMFKSGSRVVPYEVLKIHFHSPPVHILAKWKPIYETIRNFPETDAYKLLVLQAAKRLLLPIPPEDRDTSSTPNFDQHMQCIKDIYNENRILNTQLRSRLTIKNITQSEHDEERCTLL